MIVYGFALRFDAIETWNFPKEIYWFVSKDKEALKHHHLFIGEIREFSNFGEGGIAKMIRDGIETDMSGSVSYHVLWVK
jgi:hypothetical protein